MLLMLIALLVAGLFLSTLRTNSWRIPVVASALWAVIALIGGIIYPAASRRWWSTQPARQRGAVHRPQRRRHAPRARHRQRRAQERSASPTSANVRSTDDITPLKNVRLLKPEAMVGRFRTDQSQKAGLTINDLDPDRYDARRTRAAGVGRRPRARPVGHRQQVVAGPAPHQHPRLRARRWRPRARSSDADRSTARSSSTGPSCTSATRSPATPSSTPASTKRTARATTTRRLLRHRRHQARLGVQAVGLRAQLPRLQRDRLGRHRRRLAAAVDPQVSRIERRSWRRSCRSTATRIPWRSTAGSCG